MKLRKLVVSLTAAVATGAFGAAYAQSGDPAYSADQSATLSPSASSDSNVGMRNTDQNAPSSVRQDPAAASGMTSEGSSASSPSDPATPQAGSSSSTDESSSSGSSSSPSIDRDPSAPSAPMGGTYRTDSSSGSGSSGSDPVTPSQSGRQPAPY